jgi:hypothetical protein
MLLAIAVTISSAVAENPFRILADESNDSNESAVCGRVYQGIISFIYSIHLTNVQLSCVQNIDYNPPCDASSTSCWCQDTTFLSRVNHCITDANSKSVEGEFLAFRPDPLFC